jgi:outer membrane lipoprotein
LTRRPSLWLCIFFLAGLSGCAHSISENAMAKVDREKTFSAVMKNPEAYIGSRVLWGGVVENIQQEPGETKLIVSQAPLNQGGYPQTEAADREFVAHTSRPLDPQFFHRGSEITLVGEIDALEKSRLGGDDTFPVVRIIEIHAWTWSRERFPITRNWEINQSGRFIGPGVR